MRAGDGDRRCRRRQVPARLGALGIDRGDGRPGPLPPVRRGDHLLAGRRSAEAARRVASRGGRSGGDPLVARRDRRGGLVRGDRVGFPQDPGTRGRGRAAGGRVRRHPVGRADLPRPDRARRAPVLGRIDPAALHGATGAQRRPPQLAGDVAARALARRRRRGAHRGARPRRAPDEDRSRRRRQPALHRGDARDGRRSGRRGGRSAHAPGSARGSPRSARARRTQRPRACCDRRRDLPSERRPGARTRGDPGDAEPRGARPQGADQAGQATIGRRGRLPLPPPPDPGRGLRCAAESDEGGASRATRILARAARERARRAGRDRGLPPRAGLPLPGRARDARRRAGRRGTATPDRGRLPRESPPRLRRRREPVRARRRARTRHRVRPRP